MEGVASGKALIAARAAAVAADVDHAFDLLLSVPADPRARLYEAMRHAAIGGGKRLRPLLVQAAGDLFNISRESVLRVGLAVECIHVYSLVHDDLPAMDDDDLRRGKPTIHKAFDEALLATVCTTSPSKCWLTRKRTPIPSSGLSW
jgi:farnesyl diphosphate synthase